VADLRSSVGGLKLRNPFLLASGIWGESGDSMLGAWNAGAAGAVTKSIGLEPRMGYPNPTVEEYPRWGFLNAMGLPNPGIGEYPKEIARARAGGALLIGSVFGGDADAYAEVAGRMADTGVSALELNLSCPHAKGLGSEIGQDPVLVTEVTQAVVRAVRLPVWVKITPNTSDVAALALAAEAGGASAITAINTVRGLAIEPELERPVLSHGLGGLSGPAIKPVGLAAVWQIFEKVRIPIVGVGGISTGRDALEYVLAGASAVQVGTQVVWDGVGVFGRLVQELDAILDRNATPALSALVGRAHRAGSPIEGSTGRATA
jgi:dihydroorotate dehydrogenase (NAD+) catalytic subunit